MKNITKFKTLQKKIIYIKFKKELLRLLIVFHNYFKVRIFDLLLLNKASW